MLGALPIGRSDSRNRPKDFCGAIVVKAVAKGHLLVRPAGDIARPDLISSLRTLRAGTVRGGRRPSRSDLPLAGASTPSRNFLESGDAGVSRKLLKYQFKISVNGARKGPEFSDKYLKANDYFMTKKYYIVGILGLPKTV